MFDITSSVSSCLYICLNMRSCFYLFPDFNPPANFTVLIPLLRALNSQTLSLSLSPSVLLREEVAQLQEEVHLLRQMKDMLSKDLEDTQGGCSTNLLSATELRVQLGDKEQELDRAKEALQGEERGIVSSHVLHRSPFCPAAVQAFSWRF